MRYLSAFIITCLLAAPAALQAQTPEELRQQLDAQTAINEQLRRRVQELEDQLSGSGGTRAPALQVPDFARDAYAVSDTTLSAIEETLTARGLVLIAPGSYRLGLGIDQFQDGSEGFGTKREATITSITGQAGLPFGLMLTASLPYEFHNNSTGSNKGVGDFSVALSKQLSNEGDRMPMFIASLGHSHDNGEDPFEINRIGYGFKTNNAGLAALKTFDPVVVYGRLGYTQVEAADITGVSMLTGQEAVLGRVRPGDSWNYRLGTSLAVTPTINFDAAVSGFRQERTTGFYEIGGDFTSPRVSSAYLHLGAGFVLSRNYSLIVTATAGLTGDSADYIFSLYIPRRF
jgi:hypothetical protein